MFYILGFLLERRPFFGSPLSAEERERERRLNAAKSQGSHFEEKERGGGRGRCCWLLGLNGAEGGPSFPSSLSPGGGAGWWVPPSIRPTFATVVGKCLAIRAATKKRMTKPEAPFGEKKGSSS